MQEFLVRFRLLQAWLPSEHLFMSTVKSFTWCHSCCCYLFESNYRCKSQQKLFWRDCRIFDIFGFNFWNSGNLASEMWLKQIVVDYCPIITLNLLVFSLFQSCYSRSSRLVGQIWLWIFFYNFIADCKYSWWISRFRRPVVILTSVVINLRETWFFFFLTVAAWIDICRMVHDQQWLIQDHLHEILSFFLCVFNLSSKVHSKDRDAPNCSNKEFNHCNSFNKMKNSNKFRSTACFISPLVCLKNIFQRLRSR